jgi:hypothetical protein
MLRPNKTGDNDESDKHLGSVGGGYGEEDGAGDYNGTVGHANSLQMRLHEQPSLLSAEE